jgi:HD-like signal output (HDOD) protein
MEIDISKLKMPSISPDGITALRLIESDDYSMPELGKLISKDPTLSATLLKYANSPTYNPAVEITNVGRAVGVLGAKALRAAIMIASMRDESGANNIASNYLSTQSQSIARIAKLLCKQYFPSLADDVELAALLHKMGALILARNFPEEYNHIFESVKDSNGELSLAQAEREFFGHTQDEITKVFLSNLKLPEHIHLVLDQFHTREPLVDIKTIHQQQTALISLSLTIEQQINSHRHNRLQEQTPESIETLVTLLGLSMDDVENFIEDFDEMLAVEE